MDHPYIVELIGQLERTEIWRGSTERYPGYSEGIEALIRQFALHKKNGSRLFFMGNGGSAAIAGHMTVDFMKNGGMNTHSLHDPSTLTCMGNDYGYEWVFAKPLESLARPGDLAVAISSSGNSPNILRGIQAAKGKGATAITLTGFRRDNRARQMGDLNVYVPSERYGIVESIHNLILQQIVDGIMERDGAGM